MAVVLGKEPMLLIPHRLIFVFFSLLAVHRELKQVCAALCQMVQEAVFFQQGPLRGESKSVHDVAKLSGRLSCVGQ